MSAHRAPVIGARTIRAARSTLRNTRRALLTMRPTWAPLLAAVVVVTPTAAAVATWATLPPTGGVLHLPRVQMSLGATSVDAASGEATAAEEVAPTATADPRLQPGYSEGDAPPPASEAEAAPAGDPLPVWLPHTVTRWEPNIRAATSRHGVDPALVAIIMTVESAGNPLAGSHAGAQGLMQVVSRWHPRILEGGGPFDPDHNLDVGTAFLADLLRLYAVDGDEAAGWQATVQRAAAAYNGGPGGVTNPVAETRAYIRWVGGMWAERHDPTSPTFDEWRAAGGQVAIDIAATVDGPPLADAHDAPAAEPTGFPFAPRVAPGVPLPHLEASTGG